MTVNSNFIDYLQENTGGHFSLYQRNDVTYLGGGSGTNRWGANGTFLDEVKSWWDWGKAKVLDTVA